MSQDLTALPRKWELRIAEFNASGQTQVKWCETNHVKLHQLKYWLKKFKSENGSSAPSSQWVPVTMDDSFEVSKDTLQIKIGQATIEVKPGFNPSFLSDVIRTLRSLC